MVYSDSIEEFLLLSVILTGYSRADLLGTGMADQYYAELSSIVDEDICGDLWTATHKVLKAAGDNGEEIERGVRKLILDNPLLASVARNIIKMWYLGTWSELPQAWRNANGAKANDLDHVISAEAYREGLIWRAIGSHPQGAKQPGFGSWALPPAPPPGSKGAATRADRLSRR